MTYLIIILLFIAAFASATMDTIRYRWDRTIFSRVNKNSWFYKWANPAVSHKNKYFLTKFLGDNKFINYLIYLGTFLLKNPLVIFTDLWHAMKFIMLNSFFLIIIKSFLFLDLSVIIYLLFMINLLWGIFFDGIFLIYNIGKKR